MFEPSHLAHMFYHAGMGERPVRPPWPPPLDAPRARESRPARVRHVWVRAPLGRLGARQGLVVTWRQVVRGASPPSWQALVVVVDDRFERAEAQWFFATELEPVPSDPPGA